MGKNIARYINTITSFKKENFITENFYEKCITQAITGGGGGGIGFRIVGFHRKNCLDFGSSECFTRISVLINTADCGFI